MLLAQIALALFALALLRRSRMADSLPGGRGVAKSGTENTVSNTLDLIVRVERNAVSLIHVMFCIG